VLFSSFFLLDVGTCDKPIIVMKFVRGEGREIVLAPLSVLREHDCYRPTVVDVQQDDEDDNESDNLG
jgi:hypothetical protein